MSKQRKSLLRQEDFIELRYKVIVKNSTTSTQVHASAQVTITELRERGIVLRLPSGACMMGHVLLLQILPETNLRQKPATAKAPAADPSGKVVPFRKTQAEINREHEQVVREKERNLREFQAKVIEITAKVNRVEITDDGTLHVELSFYQFNEERWRHFLESFAERQEIVHRILKTVKG